MTPEAAQFKAEDAKQLLNNPILKDAFTAVEGYLEQMALSCDADDKDRAQRVIVSKQILAAIKREIHRHVDDGAIASIQIAELEKKKRFRLFQR